jgi:hypothetical protein
MNMYISRGPVSRTSSAESADVTSAGNPSHRNDLQRLQQLIERSTATGTLDRQAEAAIMAVLAQPPCYSIEKCGLFRQLQERVWQAELRLEW